MHSSNFDEIIKMWHLLFKPIDDDEIHEELVSTFRRRRRDGKKHLTFFNYLLMSAKFNLVCDFEELIQRERYRQDRLHLQQ